MGKIKMLALDLDGTLLNEARQISPNTILKLKRAIDAGIKVVPVTGRPLSGIAPYLEQLGLNDSDQYCLTFNGCLIVNPLGKVISHHLLNYFDWQCLEKVAKKFKANFHYEIDCSYTTSRDIDVSFCKESFRTRMPIHVIESAQIKSNLHFAKGVITAYPYCKADQIMTKLPRDLFDRFAISHSAAGIIEFTSKKVTKASAIHDLIEKIGLNANQVAVFGDADNDLAMFKDSDFYKVAMENAIPELKELADFVTKSNEEDGIEYAIRILEEKKLIDIF